MEILKKIQYNINDIIYLFEADTAYHIQHLLFDKNITFSEISRLLCVPYKLKYVNVTQTQNNIVTRLHLSKLNKNKRHNDIGIDLMKDNEYCYRDIDFLNPQSAIDAAKYEMNTYHHTNGKCNTNQVTQHLKKYSFNEPFGLYAIISQIINTDCVSKLPNDYMMRMEYMYRMERTKHKTPQDDIQNTDFINEMFQINVSPFIALISMGIAKELSTEEFLEIIK
jgi:hypothetical protein